MQSPPRITRRQSIGMAGGAAAALVAARLGIDSTGSLDALGTEPAAAQSPACVLTPQATEGPYFVDEGLLRSDIRSDPSDGTVRPGTPLTLTFTLMNMANGGCTPYANAAIDIWHCDADGAYSDIASGAGQPNTAGKKYLRGTQVTNSNGQVTFTTIFPGWYPGRTVHIHFKVRTFSGTRETFEFNSQLYFDPAVASQVFAQGAYASSGQSTTSNAQDGIYTAATQIPVTGSVGSGFRGALTIGLAGLPAGSSATPPTTTTDTEALVTLLGTRFVRTKTGGRVLRIRLDVDDQVKASLRILRGSKTITRKSVKALRPGTRVIKVALPRRTRGGAARLKLVLTDAANNKKTIRKALKVPGRRR